MELRSSELKVDQFHGVCYTASVEAISGVSGAPRLHPARDRFLLSPKLSDRYLVYDYR